MHGKPHWWTTKYLAKYHQPIKQMTELTREELLAQFDADFGINLNSVTHKEASDLIKEGQKNYKEFEEIITKILENRQYELDTNKRIYSEYYWRSRILHLFPFAQQRYLSIKQAENAEDVRDWQVQKASENQSDPIFSRKH